MIAEVIVDISNSEVDKIFDYEIPSSLDIKAGDRVQVPFGRQIKEGFVIKVKEASNYQSSLKSINKKLDAFTPIIPEMIDMMWKLKEENNLRLADILRLFIPAMMRGGKVKEITRKFVTISNKATVEEIMNSLRPSAVSQRGIIARLAANKDGEWASILGEEFSFSAISALEEKGFIKVSEIGKKRVPKLRQLDDKKVSLNEEQQNAVDTIISSDASTTLVFGVTGSGKTEIYMNIIANVISSGKTAIMLVPEISLTPQMMGRFRARFGEKVALLHSGLSGGERYDEWLRLYRGEATIAVGARSAIFAPLRNVGVIVIDEEHDSSYSSESNPRYVTAEVAEMRRSYNGAKLILGSATPSIESYRKAVDGEYQLITLKNRINGTKMPQMQIVDMCAELRSGNTSILSGVLLDEIKKALEKGNQSMIFLNRRGFASFMICRKCGKVMKCSDCDVSLTWHKEDNLLKCHYCGKPFPVPSVCPDCGSDNMRLGRMGTERVVEDLHKLFPSARILRMDNDTVKRKGSYDEILSAFRMGEADILVGTQMIVKGHDFPNVTLVGILDADMSLYYEDYHSPERTFQLVTQMSGRAGRADKEGKVVLQTYTPRHYIFLYARDNDYVGFYNKEVNLRETTEFPPFTKIVRVLVISEAEEIALKTTKEMLAKIRNIQSQEPDKFAFVAGMKSPIKRIENKYRYQIMVRLALNKATETLKQIYAIANEQDKKNVSIFVEVNPQNMN